MSLEITYQHIELQHKPNMSYFFLRNVNFHDVMVYSIGKSLILPTLAFLSEPSNLELNDKSQGVQVVSNPFNF